MSVRPDALAALRQAAAVLALAERLGADPGPLESLLLRLWWARSGWAPPLEPAAVHAETGWDRDLERLESGRCRALLLEVVRRAIHDWILYRNHSKLEMRQRAESAHTWLFEEGPGHPWYVQRQRDGETIMAFITICESLDLEPSYVRQRARQTTVKQIMTAGRPAERRRDHKEVRYEEHAVDDSVVNVEYLDALDAPRGSLSAYEVHFATSTPDYL